MGSSTVLGGQGSRCWPSPEKHHGEDPGLAPAAIPATGKLLSRIWRTGCLQEHRPDSPHRQVEMERIVPQGDETILLVKALRVVVLGEQVHGEDADPLRHIASRFQEVEKKALAQT